MDTHTQHRNSPRVRSPRHDCCETECPSGSRNNYFLGKDVTPENLHFEQRYSIKRRWLINRAIHGWGVVYGFALWMRDAKNHAILEAGEVGIGEGFAIDELGRELIQTHQTTLALDNVLILDKDGNLQSADGDLDERFRHLSWSERDCWLLRAHYAEKKIGRVVVRDPCRCDREEWDQTCETVVYSLRQIDCEECCQPWKCELHCCCPPDAGCCQEDRRKHDEIECAHDQVVREFDEQSTEFEDGDPRYAALQREFEPRFHELAEREHAVAAKLHPRGGCACLCDHLTGLKVGADCSRLEEVGDCTRADLTHGVSLACVRVGRDDCGHLSIEEVVDACGPRRLVKRNDLLFDLINGCDVTRIIEIGWAGWHRRRHAIPFDNFVRALGGENDLDADEVDTEDFWVRFSRPVRECTLTPEVFTMAVMSDQTEGCWREYYRVPIVAVKGSERESGDPPGHVRRALIAVSGGWLSDGVLGRGSVFRQGETHVEIGIHGDLIEDCLGQTVDANARGRSPFPSGSDGPGDTYISTFTVAQRVREPEPESKRQGYRSRQRPTAAA